MSIHLIALVTHVVLFSGVHRKMTLETGLEGKRFATHETRVGFFFGVCQEMYSEVWNSQKCLTTNFTSVGGIMSSVRCQVLSKAGLLGKFFLADVTDMGLFFSVRQEMGLDVCLPGEGFATHAAAEWLFSRMPHVMLGEVRLLSKRAEANVTGVQLHASVNKLVLFEILKSGE